MAIDLSEDGFEAAKAEGVALVDFWAPWCQPCKMLGALLESQVEPALEQRGVKVFKVNVEDCPDLAARLEILSIPALFIYRNGELAARLDGLQKPQEILDAVDSALA